MVLLVFVSGKVVLTGGKSLQDLQHTFDLMYPVFCEFRKQVCIVNNNGLACAFSFMPPLCVRLSIHQRSNTRGAIPHPHSPS